jgi:hypothetical protein
LLGLFDLAKAIRPQKTFEEITAVYADYNGISYSRLGTQGSFKERKVEAEAVS